MSIDIERAVAVASGSQEQVQRWSRILKSARVEFTVIEPCFADSSDSELVEVWVACNDCERARAALQEKDGKTRLW